MRIILFTTLFSLLADSANAIQIDNPLAVDSFQELLDLIINFVFWMGIAIAPVMLIIAGFLFVTSVGDPKRVESAKKMMLYTVIGLALVITAKSLIIVLQSILGVKVITP